MKSSIFLVNTALLLATMVSANLKEEAKKDKSVGGFPGELAIKMYEEPKGEIYVWGVSVSFSTLPATKPVPLD
jgi:hypothetical protein